MDKLNRGARLLVLASVWVTGCVEIIPQPGSHVPDDSLRTLSQRPDVPTLTPGQVWYVTTAFSTDDVTAPGQPVSVAGHQVLERVEGEVPLLAESDVNEDGFNAAITWELRVVDAAFIPEPGSAWADAARDPGGAAQPVALVEAALFGERGLESSAKDLALEYQLLFRLADYRLLEVRYSYLVGDRRITQQLPLERLSETDMPVILTANHCLLDFVMPPFPLAGHHEQMTTDRLEDGAIEVAFTSELNGELVVQRWVPGQPWFATSRSDHQLSWSHAAALGPPSAPGRPALSDHARVTLRP